MPLLASQIAEAIGAQLQGENCRLSRVAPLEEADAQSLSFLVSIKLRPALRSSKAGAVILRPEQATEAPATALLMDNPQLGFARAVELLHPRRTPPSGIHPSAQVDESAQVHPTASIGPLCVIESGVRIGPGVEIGPLCVVRADSEIGADSRLVAQVTVCERSYIGARVLLHPGAVIGREGFGFAHDGERWVRIPQIGRVWLDDEVEVGSNSAVDRGAIGETRIERGVKIDNLIQIGHNVRIGEHTAMAACSGISGSTRIGRHCTIAGAVGMAGHLEIADNVHFTGMAMVTRSVSQPGIYSSGIPAMPNGDWRRNAARFKQLDELSRRVRKLEEQLDRARGAQADEQPEQSGSPATSKD